MQRKPGPRDCRRPRAANAVLAALLAAVAGMGSAPTAAQTTAPTASTYQDRVMEGVIADDSDGRSERSYDATGVPRGYSLESLWDQRRASGSRSRSLGLRATGYADTENFGSLSGQVGVQSSDPGGADIPTYVLRQIGMPFDGGWRADNALGMINLPLPELARNSPRIGLTTPAMRGLSTHWQQGRWSAEGAGGAAGSAQAFGLQAAVGAAGSYSGYPVPSFDSSQGRYALVSAQGQQRAQDGQWQWAGALGQALGTLSALGFSAAGSQVADARGLYSALRREWGGAAGHYFVQANALDNRSTALDAGGARLPVARGLWLDGGWQQGAHQLTGGVFRLDPQLAWLDAPIASDLSGAHLRHAWRTRQWQVESSLELLDSVSGQNPSGYFASSSLRYQYSSLASWGGALQLRRYSVAAQSALVFGQFANALGSTRLQAEWASANSGERQQRLQLDHDWSFVQSARLSTSLSVDRDQRGTGSNHGFGAAVNAEWQLSPYLNMNHSLQSRWASAANQYTLNSGLTWRFAPGWSLLGNLYATQGSAPTTALAQSPLTAPAASASSSSDRGLFVALRYDFSAGRVRVPLGGAVGAGAGRLEGSVYLDTNRSGAREASETGAAQVTVLLNGRFAAQTDAQGRFEFPFVAAGEHVLTVISDNLPLPWVLDKAGRSDGRTSVRVYTRETSRVDIGAVRP